MRNENEFLEIRKRIFRSLSELKPKMTKLLKADGSHMTDPRYIFLRKAEDHLVGANSDLRYIEQYIDSVDGDNDD